MRKGSAVLLSTCALFLLAAVGHRSAEAARPSGSGVAGTKASSQAKAAFERLRGLTGEWEGTATSPDGPAARVRYELTSNGTVVMETLFPGTEHEMRTLFHFDGADLVATHYCALGNQPRMRLVKSTDPAQVSFEFVGGTNMDPAKDMHIHSGLIRFLGDRLEEEWTVYQGPKQTGTNKLFLQRKK